MVVAIKLPTASMVEQVKEFNRTVAQRIGGLNDASLSRDRPLGQARLLWEIGHGEQPGDGNVRSLRSRLHLDSGYLSRLLRSLEADGLVVVQPSPTDGRIRVARLTRAGRAERARLDQRSDELAGSILKPLGTDQRARLVEAMAEVNRLLLASTVDISVQDPRRPAARTAGAAYLRELTERFDVDPDLSIAATDDELTLPAGLLVVATLRGDPIGCAALKFHPGRPAEIKRIWVERAARGLGLGRRLLADIEQRATEHGVRTLRLETNPTLTEAIALFRSAAYREIQPFRFSKRLPR
jgi:DNA-binding MarR family transcriptional regulator